MRTELQGFSWMGGSRADGQGLGGQDWAAQPAAFPRRGAHDRPLDRGCEAVAMDSGPLGGYVFLGVSWVPFLVLRQWPWARGQDGGAGGPLCKEPLRMGSDARGPSGHVGARPVSTCRDPGGPAFRNLLQPLGHQPGGADMSCLGGHPPGT